MNKKLISSVLAGACALSMTSISAFAADAVVTELGTDGYASQEVTVTSKTEMPTLKVTIPTAADLVVNPYKLNVTTPITGSDTIISPEYEIKNESNCGVTVSATVKATPGGAAAIATSPLKGTETTKSVFMYLETTATTDTYYGSYVAKEIKPTKTNPTLSPDEEAANAACKAQMAITTKDTTKDIATLAAGDTAAQSIFFKIQGDAVTAPKTPWLAADKVDLALTLKITPNANATTGAGGPTGPAGFTADVEATDIAFGDTAFTLGALTANDTYALTIDSTSYSAAVKPTFTGYTIASASSSDTSVVAITTGLPAAKDKIDVQNTGTAEVTYNLTKDSDGSSVTVKFAVEVTA